MQDLISKLSEIRSKYNCFDDDEAPFYRALSEAIRILSKRADGDTISRADAIDAVISLCDDCDSDYCGSCRVNYPGEKDARKVLKDLPSAQPEVLACGEGELSAQPDYQEVLGWLLAYHTKSFDLHGRYLPHEVISWLINDFTKEFIAGRVQNG